MPPEISTGAAALWVLGIVGTIIIGIVTNAIWDWAKENITFTSSRWPRLKGQWSITHDEENRPGEQAVITQQFGHRFRGELHTPSPEGTGRVFIQEIRGELIDRYHALFTIKQKDESITEMGAGMITINADQSTATGKSVFFGASAPQEGMTTFKMKKQ